MPVPHPYFVDPNPHSTLKPHTTATVKYFRVSKVPVQYPYTTIPVVKVYPKQGLDTFQQVNVPFFEFRGHGRPPIDVGNPGDAYIDLNPASHALYSRTETQWATQTLWSGIESGICGATFPKAFGGAASAPSPSRLSRARGCGLRAPVSKTKKRAAKRARIALESPDSDADSEPEETAPPSNKAHITPNTRSRDIHRTPPVEHPEIDLEQLQLLSRELASLKSERESLTRREGELLKREAENTGSFAVRVMGTFREEFNIYYADVAARLPELVQKLDEAKERLRAVHHACADTVKHTKELNDNCVRLEKKKQAILSIAKLNNA
ncbi:hypothetical protein B0H10DRAFT_2221729 [Mycena sp. CBHHK59/15]|nr:hypothetical protein B0H10DRAFT_2221729 [Mycena sp. CBHHK59/15]